MTIHKEYISKENTYEGQNSPKYIVIHETDNFSIGADAKRHASAQAAGNLETSVHFYVGSDGIWQAAEIGDGTYAIGKEYGGEHRIKDAENRNTINVEICVNEDGDYQKAWEYAKDLVKYLMGETGIPAERVIRHFDAKGKYCPRKMMDDPALWEKFQNLIGQQAGYSQQQFIRDVQEVTGSHPDGIAGPETIGNTVTVSRDTNKFHMVVTPLERRLKALGYYDGEIEADAGGRGNFGKGMEAAVNAYQKEVLEYRNTDGEVTAGKNMWKSLLGMK